MFKAIAVATVLVASSFSAGPADAEDQWTAEDYAYAAQYETDFNHPQAWAARELAAQGVELPEGTVIDATDSANCGSAISKRHTGGGCTYTWGGRKVIAVSPSVVGTVAGLHILFHEAGHALGLADECEAEYFSNAHTPVELWSYPSCKR